MSRRRYSKSHAAIARRRARDVEEVVRVVLLLLVFLLVFGVLWATGWGGDIIAWASDLILERFKEQAEQIGTAQPG